MYCLFMLVKGVPKVLKGFHLTHVLDDGLFVHKNNDTPTLKRIYVMLIHGN